MGPYCSHILSVLVYLLLLFSVLVAVIILFNSTFSCSFILCNVLEMKVLNIFVFMYYAFSVITIQLWLLMVTYDCYECWAFAMHFGGHYYTFDV